MIDETATIPDTSTSGEPGQQAEAASVAAPIFVTLCIVKLPYLAARGRE